MLELPHRPRGAGQDSEAEPKTHKAEQKEIGESLTETGGLLSATKRWISFGTPAWFRGLWPWLCLFFALVLCRSPTTAISPSIEFKDGGWWAGVGVIGLIGLWFLGPRWGARYLYSDELAYLHPRAYVVGSLDYYLADPGLPSRVHRLWVMLAGDWGGYNGLVTLNFVLYGIFVLACFGLGRMLLPAWLALSVVALIVLHPGIVYRFSELRSYGCFITFSTLALWQALRLLTIRSPGAEWWFVLWVGLAGLDNPVTLVLPLTLVAMLAAGMTRVDPMVRRRLFIAACLLGLGALPGALQASAVPRSSGDLAAWWVTAMPLLLVHGIGLLRRGSHRTMTLLSIGTWLCLTVVVVGVDNLHPQTGKIDLWLFSLWFTATAAILNAVFSLERMPTAVGVLVAISVTAYMANQRIDEGGLSTLQASAKQLHTELETEKSDGLATYFLTEQDYVLFGTSIQPTHVFDLIDAKSLGLPSWNRGVFGETQSTERLCRSQDRFRIIGTHLESQQSRVCDHCRVDARTDGGFMSLLCGGGP